MPPNDKELEEMLADLQGLMGNLPPLPPLLAHIGIDDSVHAHAIVIQTNKGNITIEGSGEVTLPDGLTPSEAAKEFWKHIPIHGSNKEADLANQVKALERMVVELERGIAARNDSISRLCKELDDLKGNGQKKPDSNRFKEMMEEDDGGGKED